MPNARLYGGTLKKNRKIPPAVGKAVCLANSGQFSALPPVRGVGTKVTQGFFAGAISTIFLRLAWILSFCPDIDALLYFLERLRLKDLRPAVFAQLPYSLFLHLIPVLVGLSGQPLDFAEFGIMVLRKMRYLRVFYTRELTLVYSVCEWFLKPRGTKVTFGL